MPGNFVYTANPCGDFYWAHYTEKKTEAQAQGYHFSVVTRKKKKKKRRWKWRRRRGIDISIRHDLVSLYFQFFINKT